MKRLAGKSILILGGGSGGVVAANRLRKLLGREHSVTLVDRADHHQFAPSYLWLMLGLRKPDAVRRTLAVLRRKGIEVRKAEVLAIDPERRIVNTDAGELLYDYLIVALGAETAPELVPGLAEAGYNLYDLAGVQGLEKAVREFNSGRIVVLVSRLPFKCPAAPYEAALLLEDYFAQKGLRNHMQIEVHTPETLPMLTAGPAMGHSVAAMLEDRGIRFFPQHSVSRVDSVKRQIEFANGESATYDLLVTVPPHRSPKVLRDGPLAGETGWVPVDAGTLQTRYPNVFAVGDNAAIKIGSGMMLPKAGVFAHDQAEVVASNIAAEILGRPQAKRYDGHGYCFLELGQGRAGYATGDFYAQPKPTLQMRSPGRIWHWGKILFEKWWLTHWF